MNLNEIKEIEKQQYFNLFSRNICFTHGKGSTLYDTDGKSYTDFLAGIAVNCLGYGDKNLSKVISRQSKKVIHISNVFYNLPQTQLTQKLTSLSGMQKVFICNSGAEANEAAIKLVRKHHNSKQTGKYKILTAINSFHGRTLATATATGQCKYSEPFCPLPEGFLHIPLNDCIALKNAFEDTQIAAVMLETIQGEGGVISATSEYLTLARELTKQSGAHLIIDEVQTGVYRCGEMLSINNFDIKPDIVTLAKGLGGGMPIGAMLASGEISNAFELGDHGTTFGGNPICCAAAVEVLTRLSSDSFKQKIKTTSEYFFDKLNTLLKHNFVEKICGSGLLLGVKLSSEINGKEIVKQMLSYGYIINCAGNNTLRFAPPFIITKNEIDKMVDTLKQVLDKNAES